MKKLFRSSMEQTGVAIFVNDYGEEIIRPTFSKNPCEEARDIAWMTGDRLRDVFYTNNLLDYRIEDVIRGFVNDNNYLPENYVDELASGLPFVVGYNTNYIYCYG